MIFKNKGTAGRTGRANKKGALELSITGIVVLIIAIVVLSLIIAFVKNYFTEAGGLVGGQLQEIKSQLRKNLETSGELLIFSGGTEVPVARGSPKDYYIGIRNTVAKPACYRIAVWCVKPFDSDRQSCDPTLSSPGKVLVGGIDPRNPLDPPNPKWLSRINQEVEIPASDVEVSPITIQIPSAPPDTYQMQIDVYQQGNLGPLDDGGCDNADWSVITTPWQTKRFHIVLT